MVSNLLTFYIGLLVVLFIIAMIVIAIAFTRSGRGKSGPDVSTITTPIPESEQHNPQTRPQDNTSYAREEGVDRDFSRTAHRSDTEK